MGRYKGPEASRFGPRRGAHARLAGVPGTWRGETADRGARGAGNLETNWGCALRSKHSLQASPGGPAGPSRPARQVLMEVNPVGAPGVKALLGGFAGGGCPQSMARSGLCVLVCSGANDATCCTLGPKLRELLASGGYSRGGGGKVSGPESKSGPFQTRPSWLL